MNNKKILGSIGLSFGLVIVVLITLPKAQTIAFNFAPNYLCVPQNQNTQYPPYNCNPIPTVTATATITVTPTIAPTITKTATPVATPTITVTKTSTPIATPVPSASPTTIALNTIIAAPINNELVTGPVTILLNPAPANYWANVYVDGNFLASSPPNTFSWNASMVPPGNHIISAIYKSSSNPIIYSQAVNVVVLAGIVTPLPTSTIGTPKATPTPIVSGELRPDNTPYNQTIPNSVQLTAFHSGVIAEISGYSTYLNKVDGNYVDNTTNILNHFWTKWFPEFDSNIGLAIAVTESNWHQNAHGDTEHVTPTDPNGGSWGILQIAETTGGAGWPFTYPLSHTSTSLNADFKFMYQRACYDGKISYLADPSEPTPYGGQARYTTTAPTSANTERLWGCIGDWYSGHYYDASSKSYITETQTNYTSMPWTKPNF